MRATHWIIGLLLLSILATMIACTSDDDREVAVIPPGPAKATCEGCHADQQMLIAVAEPDEPPADEGEG